jgi:hypothetical protein
VATGECISNRIMFKQFLQTGAMQFCQIDSCRVGGVNELLAIMLLAKKFNVPVCPHAGGVGLCNYVQHLSAFNYIAIAPSLENVVLEFSDHLHEHFVDRLRVENARYRLPSMPVRVSSWRSVEATPIDGSQAENHNGEQFGVQDGTLLSLVSVPGDDARGVLATGKRGEFMGSPARQRHSQDTRLHVVRRS